MSRSITAIIVALIFSLQAFGKLQVQFSYATFYSPKSGPYVETYLYFNGEKINYVEKEGVIVGEIQVNYEFISEGNIVKENSTVVQSPALKNRNSVPPNFFIQHRIPIKNGIYQMKIRLKDLNTEEVELESIQELEINYNNELLILSDIEIIQSANESKEPGMFHKSGFEVIPYTADIVPSEMNDLGFYAELYNADKTIGVDSSFLITYYLEKYETGELVSNFKGFSRKKASQVNVIIGKFLLDNLPGGNYTIKIDVLSKTNQMLVNKSISFHKVNPPASPSDLPTSMFTEKYTNIDSLSRHIDYLQPINDRLELEFAQNQIEGRDFELMKKYFYNFWSKRNEADPEGEWLRFLGRVRIVNENFTSTLRPGYLSDRGFRYLKYGSPDDRFESFDEPSAYPYEVWYYNQVNNQTNKMIVFYNPSLVLNDFVILHSDILGEVKNKDWNLILHRMNPGFYDDESPGIRDEFGNRTRDHLRTPR
ncbi:MAG: GWxTD domain-containing protein [Vicingaceae bacterium]